MGKYIGTMYVVDSINSYDEQNGKDVFQIQGKSTRDHIWPSDRNGSNHQDNIQLLTSMSNNKKSFDLKGYINGIRFAVNQYSIDEFGSVIGIMYVSFDDGKTWSEVV